jgi:hypothetical protein
MKRSYELLMPKQTPQVAKISPHLQELQAPRILTAIPSWLIWRYEHHDGEAKPRKVPYYVNGVKRHGVQGRPEDRSSMTTFKAAKDAAIRRGYDGVGFAPMPDYNITALDFDNCMVGSDIHPEVEKLILGTYAEYSPSGSGVRAFMVGNLGDFKSLDDPKFGFETFSTKGFVTFTGNRLTMTDLMGVDDHISPVSQEVKDFCVMRFGKGKTVRDDDILMNYEPPLDLTSDEIKTALDKIDADIDYKAWLDIGMGIHHETAGSKEGFDLWNEWSSQGEKYPSEEVLAKRWKSFENSEKNLITIRTLLKLAAKQPIKTENFDKAIEQDKQTETLAKPLKFPIIAASAFSQGQAPSWIIKNIIPRAELVVLFGEAGSGKSFLALDIAASIALGTPWRGNRTKKGRAVYLVAEGGGGFRKRLTAYAMHNEINLDDLDLHIIHATPNFLEKADAVEIARTIASVGVVDIVFVDTFAQVMPGANENSSDDVGKALAHCRAIHRVTGAVVVLVHHSGKDASRGARGWSGLRAAADAEIEVTRSVNGRVAKISKQKDGEDGSQFGFDLQVVGVGVDEDGDVIDSCVVIEAEIASTESKAGNRKLGKWQLAIIEVIETFSLAQSSGIEVKEVIDEVVLRQPADTKGGRDSTRSVATRALNSLCSGDDAPYFIEDGCISVL